MLLPSERQSHHNFAMLKFHRKRSYIYRPKYTTDETSMADLGWEEDPADDDGITRLRTKLGQLRVWKFAREALEQINGKDFAGQIHPGLYVLVDENEAKVYIGESSDIRKRLKDHDKSKPELPDWKTAFVLSDGRSHFQSIFTETTLREFMEKQIIKHIFTAGIFKPINKQEEPPKMTTALETLAGRLNEELLFVLSKLELAKLAITKKKIPTAEIPIAHLKEMLAKRGLIVTKVARDRLTINGVPYFSRTLTKPRKTEPGWHTTLRTAPRKALHEGRGALVFSRGRGYLIPASDFSAWLKENLYPIKGDKEALDIYADLDNEKLYYQGDHPPLDLEKFRLN
jgi:hypothetical protein